MCKYIHFVALLKFCKAYQNTFPYVMNIKLIFPNIFINRHSALTPMQVNVQLLFIKFQEWMYLNICTPFPGVTQYSPLTTYESSLFTLRTNVYFMFMAFSIDFTSLCMQLFMLSRKVHQTARTRGVTVKLHYLRMCLFVCFQRNKEELMY